MPRVMEIELNSRLPWGAWATERKRQMLGSNLVFARDGAEFRLLKNRHGPTGKIDGVRLMRLVAMEMVRP